MVTDLCDVMVSMNMKRLRWTAQHQWLDGQGNLADVHQRRRVPPVPSVDRGPRRTALQVGSSSTRDLSPLIRAGTASRVASSSCPRLRRYWSPSSVARASARPYPLRAAPIGRAWRTVGSGGTAGALIGDAGNDPIGVERVGEAASIHGPPQADRRGARYSQRSPPARSRSGGANPGQVVARSVASTTSQKRSNTTCTAASSSDVAGTVTGISSASTASSSSESSARASSSVGYGRSTWSKAVGSGPTRACSRASDAEIPVLESRRLGACWSVRPGPN